MIQPHPARWITGKASCLLSQKAEGRNRKGSSPSNPRHPLPPVSPTNETIHRFDVYGVLIVSYVENLSESTCASQTKSAQKATVVAPYKVMDLPTLRDDYCKPLALIPQRNDCCWPYSDLQGLSNPSTVFPLGNYILEILANHCFDISKPILHCCSPYRSEHPRLGAEQPGGHWAWKLCLHLGCYQ